MILNPRKWQYFDVHPSMHTLHRWCHIVACSFQNPAHQNERLFSHVVIIYSCVSNILTVFQLFLGSQEENSWSKRLNIFRTIEIDCQVGFKLLLFSHIVGSFQQTLSATFFMSKFLKRPILLVLSLAFGAFLIWTTILFIFSSFEIILLKGQFTLEMWGSCKCHGHCWCVSAFVSTASFTKHEGTGISCPVGWFTIHELGAGKLPPVP